MATVFISYSHADRLFLDEFVPLLRRVYGNNSIWFDDDILGGHNWWEIIQSEIHDCALFIFLLSNDSLAAEYCQAEFRYALQQQKHFLPIIVRPKTQIDVNFPDYLAAILKKTQWLDLSFGFKDPQASARLYAAINSLLEPKSSQIHLSSSSTSTSSLLEDSRLEQGIRALQIGDYTKAKSLLQEAASADSYYYFSLALLKRKTPYSTDQVTQITQKLALACNSDNGKSHYYYLWAWVIYKFYRQKNFGLKHYGMDYEELISSADSAPSDKDKLKQLVTLSAVDGPVLERISERMKK